MAQMDHLLRLREGGVRFDAYLMDAFWYDPSGAYRTWRKSTWPNGPDHWFETCEKNGLLPGLWFTANTLFHLDLPKKWADSIDEKGWGLCLFEGGFLEDFIEVLDLWYRRGIRLFKLDFAEFGAVPAGSTHYSPLEARERNIAAYRSAIGEFKWSHPGAIFMAFNGFDERECMDRSDRPPGRWIDPQWLETMDSIYVGDPRPSDLPSEDLWRSVDIYSDCMTRLFESSDLPLSRLDNCGFMAGPTGTCYWRGKAGWKEMFLLSLARGGKIHVAYGDLSLFDETDAQWWARAQELYRPGTEEQRVRSVGGWPGAGEPYGWTDDQVLTIVNPKITPADWPKSDDWNCVFRTNIVSIDPDSSELKLAPGSITVFAKDGERLEDEPLPLMLGIRSEISEVNRLELEGIGGLSGSFLAVFEQKDESGGALRAACEEGRFPFRFEVEDAQGRRELPPLFERTIWSGISWSTARFQATELSAVRVQSLETRPNLVRLRLYRDVPMPYASRYHELS